MPPPIPMHPEGVGDMRVNMRGRLGWRKGRRARVANVVIYAGAPLTKQGGQWRG